MTGYYEQNSNHQDSEKIILYSETQYNRYGQLRVNSYSGGGKTGTDEFLTASVPHTPVRKSNLWLRIAVAVLAVAFFISIGISIWLVAKEYGIDRYIAGTVTDTDETFRVNINNKPLDYDTQSPLAGGSKSTAEVVSETLPSVVLVDVYNLSTANSISGSGVVLSQDGYIVTNYHLLTKVAEPTVKITLENGAKYPATVVGHDEKSDIAILKINADGLVGATLGNSDQVVSGEMVLAIGNPGGLKFKNTVTLGVVSDNARYIDTSNGAVAYIQTDAAVNSGNSGGPLVNMYGQVIGIVTSKLGDEDYSGIGFAIPINTAKPIIDNIISTGVAPDRAMLGITYTQISSLQAEYYNLPPGIRVTGIYEESPLSDSKLKIGDIIIRVDGAEVNDSKSLLGVIDSKSAGDKVLLSVYRPNGGNGETFDVEATLISDELSGDAAVKTTN